MQTSTAKPVSFTPEAPPSLLDSLLDRPFIPKASNADTRQAFRERAFHLCQPYVLHVQPQAEPPPEPVAPGYTPLCVKHGKYTHYYYAKVPIDNKVFAFTLFHDCDPVKTDPDSRFIFHECRFEGGGMAALCNLLHRKGGLIV